MRPSSPRPHQVCSSAFSLTGAPFAAVLFVIAALFAMPATACCYEAPEDDSAGEEAAAPPAEDEASSSGDEEPAAPSPARVAEIRAANDPDNPPLSTAVPRFTVIRQMMADGRYLAARREAEARLKTRPYDHRLWALLEQIYSRLGLQGRTANAAYQAKVSAPDWRPPAPPPPPVSAQKRYVGKLLQAVREFKPID